MKLIGFTALMGGILWCGAVAASAELAQEKQCVQCHKITEDFAGPSFHKIAMARKNERDGLARMVVTIRRGSNASGGPHWGTAKMPDMQERPEVSHSEARTLARWILQQ